MRRSRSAAALALCVAAGLGACRRGPREVLITYFNGEHGLSVRYPASWTTEQAEQEGVWYRYFLAPPAGAQRKPAVSVTLLVGRLGGPLDAYARTYLAANRVTATADESRSGGSGRSWQFDSPDGAIRHALLLLKEDQAPAGDAAAPRVYGLYAQAESASFDRQRPVLEEMAKSLTLERPALYPELRDPGFGFSLRLPPSWRETRHFSGSGTLLMQFTSPALAADQQRETVHASLTLTAETLPAGGSLDGFYEDSRAKLGDGYRLLNHHAWGDGYVDSLRAETTLSAARQRRFYRVAGGRGYCLNFEARDDVFHPVARWADLIAETFAAPAAQAAR